MTPAPWWYRPRYVVAVVSLLVAVSLGAPGAAAQAILQRPLPGSEPPGVPGQPALQPPLRAPITLTPSVGIAEEYNDNVRLNNDRRTWDLITVITPGLTLTAERPTWRLNAGYEFDARFFAREPDRNNGFDRQSFSLDSFYRVDPTVTLSLDDAFTFNTGINAFAPEGVATGRDRAWGNTIRPGVTWQIDRLTTGRVFGAWTAQRFERSGLRESDAYRGDVSLDRALTPRLRGTVGYGIAYFDIEQAEEATTHTPRVGLSYEFTPTMTGSISGGPTFEIRDDDTRITPAVTAALRKRYAWGATTVSYTRDVGTAGGLGGTSDNQTAALSVVVGTLLRGLTLEVGPQYRTSESDDDAIDVRAFSLPLRATYQITPWFGLTAGYSFLHQRSDSTVRSTTTGELLGRDIDQNRVFVGILVGYPIKFD